MEEMTILISELSYRPEIYLWLLSASLSVVVVRRCTNRLSRSVPRTTGTPVRMQTRTKRFTVVNTKQSEPLSLPNNSLPVRESRRSSKSLRKSRSALEI